MSRIAYVNGQYMSHGIAAIHIEDRATQFADAVYEVFAVFSCEIIDADLHYDRLERSLAALEIQMPMSRRALHLVIEDLINRNRLKDGICYLQISRGSAPRNHAFPKSQRSSLTITAKTTRPGSGEIGKNGVRVITTSDQRWARRDIKSVSLLPNVLAKEEAVKAGAFEAWLVDDDGVITEGSHSNAWLVDESETVITHQEGHKILSGITRNRVISIARRNGIKVIETSFTMADVEKAKEAFLTSTSSFVVPVVRIDQNIIAQGDPGPITNRIRELYLREVQDFVQTI